MDMNQTPLPSNRRSTKLINNSDNGINKLLNISLSEILENIIENIPVSLIDIDSESGDRTSKTVLVLNNLKKFGITRPGSYPNLNMDLSSNITLTLLEKNKESVIDWTNLIQDLNKDCKYSYLSLGMFRFWAKAVLLLVGKSISDTTTTLFRLCDDLGVIKLTINIDFSLSDKIIDIYFKLYEYQSKNLADANYDYYKDNIKDYITVKLNGYTNTSVVFEYIGQGIYKASIKLLELRSKVIVEQGSETSTYLEENTIELIYKLSVDDSTKISNKVTINIPKWAVFKVQENEGKYQLVDELMFLDTSITTKEAISCPSGGEYTSYFTVMSIMEPYSFIPDTTWIPDSKLDGTKLSNYSEDIITDISVESIDLNSDNKIINNSSIISIEQQLNLFNKIYKLKISYNNVYNSTSPVQTICIKNMDLAGMQELINLSLDSSGNNSILISNAKLHTITSDGITEVITDGISVSTSSSQDGNYELTITIAGGLKGDLDLELKYFYLFDDSKNPKIEIKDLNELTSDDRVIYLSFIGEEADWSNGVLFKKIDGKLGTFGLRVNNNVIKISNSPTEVLHSFTITPSLDGTEFKFPKLTLNIRILKEPSGILLKGLSKSYTNYEPNFVNSTSIGDFSINTYNIKPKSFTSKNKLSYGAKVEITSTNTPGKYKLITEDLVKGTSTYYYCEEKPELKVEEATSENKSGKLITTFSISADFGLDLDKFAKLSNIGDKPYYEIYLIPDSWEECNYKDILKNSLNNRNSDILCIRLYLIEFIVFRGDLETKSNELDFHLFSGSYELITLNAKAYYLEGSSNLGTSPKLITKGPSSMPFHPHTKGGSYNCGDGLKCGGSTGSYWWGGSDDRYLNLKFYIYSYTTSKSNYGKLNITYRVDDDLYFYINNKLTVSYDYSTGKSYSGTILNHKKLLHQYLKELSNLNFNNGLNILTIVAHNSGGGENMCQFGIQYNTCISASNYSSWGYNNYLQKN